MRRGNVAQLELPLSAPDGREPVLPAARPAIACGRCGWLGELGATCPLCQRPAAGPRLPPRRRG